MAKYRTKSRVIEEERKVSLPVKLSNISFLVGSNESVKLKTTS